MIDVWGGVGSDDGCVALFTNIHVILQFAFTGKLYVCMYRDVSVRHSHM